MKNLAIGAAVSAVLSCGVANAVINVNGAGVPIINPADTYEVFLSGASAPAVFLEQLFTSSKVPGTSRLCNSSKIIYKFSESATATNQTAYLCELNTANPALKGLAAGKTNLLLYKRNAGGSAQGVNPVVADAAIAFLKVDNAANCTNNGVSGGLTRIVCSFTEGNLTRSQNVKPDFGVSDVDPIQFQGVNTPSGFDPITASDLAKIEVKAAAAQAFGIVVTTKLRNALQEAQFAASNKCNPKHANYAANAEKAVCMPSLNTRQITSIFAGNFNNWDQLKIGATGLFSTVTTNKPTNSRVHICRRVSGSGTQAQLNAKFLNYPCTEFATLPAVDTGLLSEASAQAQVHAMSSSSNLSECMSELDLGVNTVSTNFNQAAYPGTRWAIGIQGTDTNNTRTGSFRFIKIDGNAPTLLNVVNGKYHDWVELTFQYNKTHTFDTSEKNIVDEIIKQAGNPNAIGAANSVALHSWGQAGFLAVPQSFTPDAEGELVATKPVNPLSHGTTTAGPNACRFPARYNPGATSGMQLK